MHIYLDESGTVGRGNSVVSAIRVDPSGTRLRRLLKRLSKEPGGEVKGHIQPPNKQRQFLAEVAEVIEAVSVVGLDRSTRGWAAACGENELFEIYARAAAEAILQVHATGVQGVTLDSSPFKASVAEQVVDRIEASCRASGINLDGKILHGDSRREKGLQVADVLCNAAFGDPNVSLAQFPAALSPFDPLVRKGALRPVSLNSIYRNLMPPVGAPTP